MEASQKLVAKKVLRDGYRELIGGISKEENEIYDYDISECISKSDTW